MRRQTLLSNACLIEFNNYLIQFEMSFGQKILEKYGYKDGSGLGKREDGITAPVKANFKVNSTQFYYYSILIVFCF